MSSITLPFSPNPSAATEAICFAPDQAAACRKPAALLVEDDPDVSAIMCLLLTDCGFDVRSTESGQEGLQLARSFAPDIVVLDVNLPGMNGLEVCRRLKADPKTSALPIVFCSGERQYAEEAMSLGASAFLAKPDGILKLPDCLRETLCLASASGGSRQIAPSFHRV